VKVLRILRRRKIRLSFIFILLLFFIVNSYAWISYDRTTESGALTAKVSSWAVEFVVDNEALTEEEYTFEIEEFYPGIEPISKKIMVYNIGAGQSSLEYKITDIYLYGKQILRNEIEEGLFVAETAGEETTDAATGYTTANVFGNSGATIFNSANVNYGFFLRYPTPFTISYTYDKNQIEGSDGSESSKAWMSLNFAWYNDEANNEEDTKLGNMAYDYKVSNPDEPALKVVVKAIARRSDVNN